MKNYSSLLIGGKQFSSRLMVGTGKYKSTQDMIESLSNSETEIITVAVRRIKNDQTGENLLEKINWKKYWMLPNTAGCVNADEAVRIAILGRELAKLSGQEENNFVKLEVIPDKKYLLPDPIETLKAAEILEKEGIKCNLTLLFNFCQAVTCANAKITLISPFVGRILDWHKSKTGKTSFVGAEDPGVISVTQIYKYFKEKGFKTEVMGASFRNLDEIKELAGCDLLTIAPKFLEELKKEKGELVRKLDESFQINNSIDYEFEEKDFRLSMLEDQMASEKLSEGITGFSKAIEELEELLLKRYSEIKNHKLISAN